MWASIRCGSDPDVRGVHAKIVDHSAGDSLRFGPCLCVVPTYSRAGWRDH